MLHFSQSKRDQIRSELSDSQNDFLDNFLKRGKKTTFANEIAKSKANSKSKENIAADWELVDYLDAGSNWNVDSQLFYECGRKLRYQYVIRNLKTEDKRKFGVTHFEEHTGISPQLANRILKGFEEIDYELDEILLKIINGWNLSHANLDDIPESIEISKDIQLHIDNKMPLLDRQINRLKNQISDLNLQKEMKNLNQGLSRGFNLKKTQKKIGIKDRREKEPHNHDKFKKDKLAISETKWWKAIKSNADLDNRLKLGVIMYLFGKKTIVASDICDYLVEDHGAPAERRQSGYYVIFSYVCIFLEELVKLEKLNFSRRVKGIDRIYEVVDPFLLNDYKKLEQN